jgi:spermidine/putrescine transport system permease protein
MEVTAAATEPRAPAGGETAGREAGVPRLPVLRSRRWMVGPLLASPLAAFMILFFIVPSIMLFAYSFWIAESYHFEPALSLRNYQKAFLTPIFYSVTWTGIKIGAITALLSLLGSFPIAYYIVFKTRSNAILYIVVLTWFSSYLVRIYAWRTILGSNGLINSGLKSLGLIDQPLEFILFSPLAVVITLVHIFLPFALLLLVSALRDVKPEYLEAARDLGASFGKTLWRVVLPLTSTGVIGTFMFTFVLAAGDYVTPQLVGGRTGVTTGVLIADQFKKTGNWPLGSAMAFILLAVFLFAYFLVLQGFKLMRWTPRSRWH